MSDTASSPTNGNGNGTVHEANGHGNNGWGSAYTDPAADITLLSTEGRHFKVESYNLKANSAFFREVLALGTNTEPIKVDVSNKYLKLYLDIMHLHHLHSSYIWKHHDQLLRLCDALGSPGVAERAMFNMHDAVEKDPWAVFVLASQRGNFGLAKSALRAMADKSDTPHLRIDKLTPTMAGSVSLSYLLGLFNAALQMGDIAGDDKISWKVVADKFTPVVG